MQLVTMLDDAGIELFMQIIREYFQHIEIHDVQYFAYLHLLKPARKHEHLQIIDGNSNPHWICTSFDGDNSYIYDGSNRVELMFFHPQERAYLEKRYLQIPFSGIIIVPVTQKPDSISCGAYSAAFVTDSFWSRPGKYRVFY